MKASHLETFTADNRINVVKDLKELNPCRREFNQSGGVLFAYDPFTPEETAEAIAFARSLITLKDISFIGQMYDGSTVYKKIPIPYPESFNRVTSVMKEMLSRSTGRQWNKCYLKINGINPSSLHTHASVVVYVANVGGTIAVNEEGVHYSVMPRQAFVIGPGIRHMAAQKQSLTRPRISFEVD